MSSICLKCGKQLKPDAVFCGGCGTSLGQTMQQPTQQSVVQQAHQHQSQQGISKQRKPGFFLALASLISVVLFFAFGMLLYADARTMAEQIFALQIAVVLTLIPLVLAIIAMVKGSKGFMSISEHQQAEW